MQDKCIFIQYTVKSSKIYSRYVGEKQQKNNNMNLNVILANVSPAVESNGDKLMKALQLMGIGMATVFVVLLIIIFLGTLLIKTVNKFFPEEVKPVAKAAAAVQAVDQNIQEAINKAILAISGGKKQAQKIEKI